MAEESRKNSANPAVPPPLGTGQPVVNPMALSVEEVSRLLSAAGGKRITAEQIQADLDAGAPVGPDGKINLVHYAAWLVREVQTR
ncbi:MAG TPA: hypothetical protein PLP01_08140 [Phycisphaerae bacterium]|jgi:hypothetical protein|nr:hypothetical protein [Phycisphaerae bacterium]HOA76019.1 hypothetical protein [Phycisphaerae bacterium]HOI55203.1 hypothetical protein [Phycisphaerae bacterium]